MADASLGLVGIGPSREVQRARPSQASWAGDGVPRTVLLIGSTSVGLACVPLPQTRTITGAVVAEDGSRALVAGRTGAIDLPARRARDTVRTTVPTS